MGYTLYAITFIFLITATVVYLTRPLWLPHAPPIPYLTAPGPIPSFLYDLPQTLSSLNPWGSQPYIRLSSFNADIEQGFSSANFDLQQNVRDGDSRQGLDEEGKQRIKVIMKDKRVGFDEARRIAMEERFGRENVGRDGRPRDPKAVMFDRL